MNATVTLNRSETELEPVSLPVGSPVNMVEVMAEAGLAPVPLKPTAAMLAAGSRAGQVSVETVWKIYQAMLHESA